MYINLLENELLLLETALIWWLVWQLGKAVSYKADQNLDPLQKHLFTYVRSLSLANWQALGLQFW